MGQRVLETRAERRRELRETRRAARAGAVTGDRTARATGLAALLVALVRIYQFFSRMTPRRCRFHPTCSQYAVDALHAHGPWRGTGLALRRIGRCHPWNPGGYDPIPPGP